MADAIFSMPSEPRLLVYAHLGDLPLTDAKAVSYREWLVVLALLEMACASQPDFVYLPGRRSRQHAEHAARPHSQYPTRRA